MYSLAPNPVMMLDVSYYRNQFHYTVFRDLEVIFH